MPVADSSASLSGDPGTAAGSDPVQEDSARAETLIPIGVDALFDFISDLERLFRLNPHLEIEVWQRTPDGLRFVALNETNGRRIETMLRVETQRSTRSIVLRYVDGLKRATTLAVEEDGGSASRLVVTEHYPVVTDAQDPRIAEVDRSLVSWVSAVRRHLLGRRRWSWLPGWLWWHERFLPGLAPRQRRIVRLIVWISVLEFVLFLLVAAIFWAEQRSG